MGGGAGSKKLYVALGEKHQGTVEKKPGEYDTELKPVPEH